MEMGKKGGGGRRNVGKGWDSLNSGLDEWLFAPATKCVSNQREI